MGVLTVENLGKSFGVARVFSDVSFEMRRGDKVGLIGDNGAGKTTLFRIMLGMEEAEEGRVRMPDGDTIGYVRQESVLGGGTLYQELVSAYQDVLDAGYRMEELTAVIAEEKDPVKLDAAMKEYGRVTELFERSGGYEYEANIRRVASGLGFSADDLERDIATFSGGQKTRIHLAKALIRKPDFLFLDEPTNHLDIDMVEWLEGFLKEYGGGVLIISHDRYFLDQVVDRVLELEQGSLRQYRGNYSDYLRQKAEYLETMARAYEKQQEFISKEEEFIRRYKNSVKSRQARGREKRLNRLERIDMPKEEDSLDFSFLALNECADRVAELREVTAAYGSHVIFEKLSLLIRRGEGVALVGPNGAGKTTLLKLITGEMETAKGRMRLGERVKIGYFAQEHEQLRPENRVVDEIMYDFGVGEDRARSLLGHFLFQGDDVWKSVGMLSGGEKARLALLKLMLTGANFLVLDEPTNHLDISSREAVEDAIMSFPGTFLTVSHDRYFLDRVADRMVELADGTVTEYSGNYSYYREKKGQAAARIEGEKALQVSVKEEAGKKQWRQRPRDQSRQIQKLEEAIALLEKEKSYLEQRLNDPASHDDMALSRELAEEYEEKSRQLEKAYGSWMELTEDSGNP